MTPILNTLKFITSHPLASKRPMSAYGRYVSWQIKSRLCAEVEFAWIGGSKLIARNGMAGATGNIYCGLHEFGDMAFVMHLLRQDDLFIDVGANVGSYTVLASAVCEAKTIAVEPDPDAMRDLKRNVAVNGVEDRVALVEAALGAESGAIRFTVGKGAMNRVASAADAESRVVQLLTLDEVLKDREPTAIKIDIEGYEPEAIAGAMNTIQNASLLAILIETVGDRVAACLADFGFQQAAYSPANRALSAGADRQLEMTNLLFVRDIDECRRRLESAAARDVLGWRI